MTKKKTRPNLEEEAKEEPQKQYVILKRIKYKAFVPGETEYIDAAEDPYAPDAPRRPFDHLRTADINLLILRGVIAPDKE